MLINKKFCETQRAVNCTYQTQQKNYNHKTQALDTATTTLTAQTLTIYAINDD